jgi:transcriptional regulator with XRE-family HTH domain
LHEPSVRVLKAIAGALNMSAETLLKQAGLLEEEEAVVSESAPTTEKAIAADQALTPEQRTAMLAVYRSYVEANVRERAKKPRA